VTHQSKKCSRAGSRWPVVLAFSACALLSATTIVAAGPSWAHRAFTGAAAALSLQFVHAAYRPSSEAQPTGTADDYVQGLAKAVPGLVVR
jgi:hypothetical protein